jgi:oligopeptide transport system substrate-binding protein
VEILQQVFEGLVGMDEHSNVRPALASSWDSAKGSVYVFHLRAGVCFSDGTPLTSSLVKTCLERNCLKALKSPTSEDILGDVEGEQDYRSGNAQGISGIQADDKEQTITFTLRNAVPYFLEKLTHPAAWVYKLSDDTDENTEITDFRQIVGTGAYQIDAEDQRGVNLSPNRLYGGTVPDCQGIQVSYAGDASTRLAMFEVGEANLVTVEGAQVKAAHEDTQPLKFQGPYSFYDYTLASVWYLSLAKGPTGREQSASAVNDVRVRKAIALAINRGQIAKQIRTWTEGHSLLPPGVPRYKDTVADYPFDPGKAADLWKSFTQSSNNSRGSAKPGRTSITLWFRSNRPDAQMAAVLLQRQLLNVGIKVNLRATEWGEFIRRSDDASMSFSLRNWVADYPDPQDFLSTLLRKGSKDYTRYDDDRYAQLCKKADVAADQETRLKLYQEAEDYALKDAVIIPIAYSGTSEIVRGDVKPFVRHNLMGHLPLGHYENDGGLHQTQVQGKGQ